MDRTWIKKLACVGVLFLLGLVTGAMLRELGLLPGVLLPVLLCNRAERRAARLTGSRLQKIFYAELYCPADSAIRITTAH